MKASGVLQRTAWKTEIHMVRWLKGSSGVFPVPIIPSESDQSLHKNATFHPHCLCAHTSSVHFTQLVPQINTESTRRTSLSPHRCCNKTLRLINSYSKTWPRWAFILHCTAAHVDRQLVTKSNKKLSNMPKVASKNQSICWKRDAQESIQGWFMSVTFCIFHIKGVPWYLMCDCAPQKVDFGIIL